jgi:signal peptidase I
MVDLEASVWINGRQILRHRFDLSIDTARLQPPPPPYPSELSITLRGGPASLRDVEVDRDLYYEAVDGIFAHDDDNDGNGRHHRARPGHGVLIKEGDERYGEPFVLQQDQFYCLGDNSPLSGDSRQWSGPDPWVRAMFLADDPTPAGVVPRKLMMGRAVFVYWPAPFAVSPRGPSVIPNFADMRFIH